MARDYKNAGSRSKATSGTNKKPAPAGKKRGAVTSNKPKTVVADKSVVSPMLSMSLGLGIGLSVAAYIYFISLPTSVENIEPEVTSVVKTAEPTPTKKLEEVPDDGRVRFDFYSILPKLEVVIPDQEIYEQKWGSSGEGIGKTIKPIKKQGRYLLQVGSFRKASDAERVKVELAFLGIESYIEPVVIDSSKTWHRVRVGPFSDNKTLGKIRNRLLDNRIEVMVLKIKEG
ncbi:hypothetical protein MNBD_GAMMA18-1532 [hydrothermal vent metagenome]|uniref:SPOR domain-containing protein n=1 Tax=hydrothermal vent metagenome TaxID=652676 RepID=A0A3B0YSJ9_9ZZZZ